MFNFIKPQWKVNCSDQTGLIFVLYLRARQKHELETIIRAKGWVFHSAVAEPLVKGFFKSRTEVTYATTVNIKYLISFYRQMANMYRNSVPLAHAIRIAHDSTESASLKLICRKLEEDLQGGADLASSVAKFPNVFDRKAAITLRAAQQGGYLDKAFTNLAKDAELSSDINKKLNGAMIYPTAIVLVAIAAIVIFAFKVIPNFKPLYEAIGFELPFPTRVMLGLSTVLTKFPIIAVIAIGIPVYVFVRKREIFTQPRWQTLFTKLPLIKNLTVFLYLSRYARMISQLTDAAIGYPAQVTMLKESSLVPAFRSAWEQIGVDIGQGVGFTDALEKHIKLLTPLFVGNIRVGEHSGTISESAAFVADYYEEEVRNYVKNMNAIVEPFLIVFIGFIVGFLLFAMFLPLFDITRLVKG